MSIQIPDELSQYVQAKVEAGDFKSEDDFAAEAIRLYRDMEARHASLRDDINHAIEQADRGELEPLDIDAIKAKARQRLSD